MGHTRTNSLLISCVLPLRFMLYNILVHLLQSTAVYCLQTCCNTSCFVLLSSTTTDNDEERKLLQCLRKSVLSPYKKQLTCLPTRSVADNSTSSPSRKIETRSLTSPRVKRSVPKTKPSPHHESVSKTWWSPRRATPSKRATVKPCVNMPLRKTQHFPADNRKKTGLTPRRTPSKKRSQTPRKSTKRTPAKSMLTVLTIIFLYLCFCSYMCIKV